MATYYTALDKLFSSIKLEETGPQTKITLFINGQNIGTLVANKEDRTPLLELLFTEDANRGNDPVHKNRFLLSEYGELKIP